MTLTLYHLPGTRSVRPLWLCYELDLPVTIERADATKNYRDTAEFRKLSPAGKIPALTDDDVSIFESGAIIEFLLDRYGNGRLRPEPGSAASATYQQWCWFAEATLIRPVGLYRILRAGATQEEPQALTDDAKKKFHDALQSVEGALDEQSFLLGDNFSAADIMLGYSLAITERLLGADNPRAKNYLERLKQRPAYIRAFKD